MPKIDDLATFILYVAGCLSPVGFKRHCNNLLGKENRRAEEKNKKRDSYAREELTEKGE